jgi:hypothetical protein
MAARGSSSFRAIARYFRASSRASASVSSLSLPNPISHRLPRTTVRSFQRFAPDGDTPSAR